MRGYARIQLLKMPRYARIQHLILARYGPVEDLRLRRYAPIQLLQNASLCVDSVLILSRYVSVRPVENATLHFGALWCGS